MGFEDVLEMECVTYKQLLVNAFIERCNKSEEGKQYLKDAYRLTHSSSKADRKGLTDLFG